LAHDSISSGQSKTTAIASRTPLEKQALK